MRRYEQKQQSVLRGTPYIWLRNPDTLSERQRATLENRPTRHPKTARSYQIRLAFHEFYDKPPKETAGYLKKWYFWATPLFRDNAVFRWVYDTEIVGDVIAVCAPVLRHHVAQEGQHHGAEVLEAGVALVVGDVPMHQGP